LERNGGPPSLESADILFVSETEHKYLPLVPKFFTTVKLRMLPYTLIGQVHYPKGRCIRDVLNSMFRFFPMTNVEVCSLAGGSELEVSFLAVNKERILALEELGDSVKGVYL